MTSPSHAIFIRSYYKDAEWLRYCLRSCREYAPDTRVVIVSPPDSEATIRPIAAEFGHEFYVVPVTHKNGYIDQQFTKITADQWVDEDYIIHLDSDCLLLCPLDALFHMERPVMLKTAWKLLAGDQAVVWRGVVDGALGINPDFEFMRRHPLVYPRTIYPRVRAALEARHGSLVDWFRRQTAFSEFNVLGAWCHQHAYDEFHWIDTEHDPLPPPFVRQGWSWGGFEAARAEWESIVSKYGQPATS